MRKVKFGMVLALLLVWAGIAVAADFSADLVTKSAKGQELTSKMFFAKDKMRTEAMGSISITRMDKDVMWHVMPAQKAYMEMKIPAQGRVRMGSKAPGELKREKMGRETVNGFSRD